METLLKEINDDSIVGDVDDNPTSARGVKDVYGEERATESVCYSMEHLFCYVLTKECMLGLVLIMHLAVGTLEGNPLDTTGVIELGGASAQVWNIASQHPWELRESYCTLQDKPCSQNKRLTLLRDVMNELNLLPFSSGPLPLAVTLLFSLENKLLSLALLLIPSPLLPKSKPRSLTVKLPFHSLVFAAIGTSIFIIEAATTTARSATLKFKLRSAKLPVPCAKTRVEAPYSWYTPASPSVIEDEPFWYMEKRWASKGGLQPASKSAEIIFNSNESPAPRAKSAIQKNRRLSLEESIIVKHMSQI